MDKSLLQEKLLPLSKLPSSLQKELKGALRIVDQEGQTYGLFLDKEALEDLAEDLEYATPEFWKEIKESRQSGTVSSEQIEDRLGL